MHAANMSVKILLHLKSGLAVPADMATVDFESMGASDVMVQLIEARKTAFTTNGAGNNLTSFVCFDVGFEGGNIADVGVTRETTELCLQSTHDSTAPCVFIQVVDTIKSQGTSKAL